MGVGEETGDDPRPETWEEEDPRQNSYLYCDITMRRGSGKVKRRLYSSTWV
jgi:hypothetical protein